VYPKPEASFLNCAYVKWTEYGKAQEVCLLIPLVMEAISTSRTSVSFQQTTGAASSILKIKHGVQFPALDIGC
jgi:hypothetical protein